MCESMLNHEGYADPTAGKAVNNILAAVKRRFRPMVFICSPFAGDIQGNIERARRYCRFATMKGCIPIAPHLHFPQFLDDGNDAERELGLFMGLAFLAKCKAVWVFGSRVSPGMEKEIRRARRRKIPVRYFTDACKEVTPFD